MAKPESEINENTKMRLGLIFMIVMVIGGALVQATMIYSQHKDLPEKYKKLQEEMTQMKNIAREQCYFNKNLQLHLLKPDERYSIDCTFSNKEKEN